MSAQPGIYDVRCPYCAAIADQVCATASGKPCHRHDPHQARWDLLRRETLRTPFVVRIKRTDERLGVRAGEEYAAIRYWLDPGKVTLLRRIPDGYDPSCNQYITDAKFVRWEAA
ncbi:hypothetical protein ABZ546_13805 [Brachybacterium paraconglomeratum]